MSKKEQSVLRIFALEASHEILQSLEHQLRQADMHCAIQAVVHSEKFIAALDECSPDLLLVVHKPERGTLALLRNLRAERPDLPVVVITKKLDDLEALALMDAGAKGYVRIDRLDMFVPEVRQALSRERGIRKRKQVERDLRMALEQLRLFRALIDQSADSVEIVDPETLRILDANETAWRSLGYTREELLSLSVSDIDPAADPELVRTVGKKLDKTGHARFEGRHRRKDGSTFPVEINLRQVKLDRSYRLSVARDISARKQAETELLRLNRLLRTLSEGNRTVLRAGNSAQLMRDMCDVITGIGGYPLAWIGLTHDGDRKSINPVAISGDGSDYVKGLHLRWDDSAASRGPMGNAILTGRAEVVQDINTYPGFGLWRESVQRYGYASFVALPLEAEDKSFGALAIYSKDTDAFGDSEVELLQELTSDLAAGLVNLHTRHELDKALTQRQRDTDRLRANMEDTIQAIATVLEMRDAYTAGHQRRVADLATVIARQMGLSEEQVHGLHLASIVHDIGKIHIPAEILNKPARLNDLEYSFVKTHSQAGYDILKGISFPWPIAEVVLQHHERLNGSGYPLGLSGNGILLEARILCVADVIESMAFHRPYRPGLGIDAALEEIIKNRGVLYDPTVVDAAHYVFIDNKYQFPTSGESSAS